MKLFKNESGRSMLEVLAVIGIVVLLTLGGLTGYSYLVQTYNRQEVVKEVNQLVLGLKSIGGSRRYAKGNQIPLREVIQGPKMNEQGLVMYLPDDAESYATVTSLEGDAFELALKVEPGTCETLVKALQASDGYVKVKKTSGFDCQGDNCYASAKNLTEEQKESVVAACKESAGADTYVYVCPSGSNTYRYVYDNDCHLCPKGQDPDVNGDCCVASTMCGGVCNCARDGKVCDTDKNVCVICKQDSDCRKKYNNAWVQHICDNGECIECKNHNDCQIDGAAIGLVGQNRDAKYCENGHCIECITDYQDPAVTGMCPTTAKPMCLNGKCYPCSEGMVWNAARAVCECPQGLITHDGKCVYCYDSVQGNGRDAGCPADTPICDEQGTTNVNGVEASGYCTACNTDEQCPTGTPNWYCSENHACVECPTDRPYFNVLDRKCYPCMDDRTSYFTDSGCGNTRVGQEKVMCKPLVKGETLSGSQYSFGESCHVCLNDKTGGNKDTGCSDDQKLCDAADNEYGNACHKCQNDQSAAALDSGCVNDNPICVDSNATEVAHNAFGTTCAKCINDQEGMIKDTGCTDMTDNGNKGKPMCNGAKGKAGTECSRCPDEKPLWNEKLAACSGKGSVETCCAVCYDDATSTTNDAGCTTNAKPICLTPESKNDGTGTNGTKCVECVVDANCPTEKPVCNQSTNACEPCPNGTVYHNGKCVVCFDNKQATAQDTGCSAAKPVCFLKGSGDTAFISGGSNKDGDVCVECLNDGQCPTDKPYCSNYTCVNCGPDSCIDSTGKCIPLTTYDDIERDANGSCKCVGVVRTQDVRDMGNSYNGGSELEKNYNCDRLTTARKRLYKIPVNFYCARYMHVDNNASADDFVDSSSPSGIGANSKHDSWGESHDNSISPRVSNSTIKNGTATLVVSDRWSNEVGLNGYFYFTKNKGDGASGAVQKLRATSQWNPGSSQSSPTTGYRCKQGAGSSAKQRATGDAHCCR